MNRDQLAALGRAIVSLAIGGVVLYAIARWLGWWAVAAIAVGAVADLGWSATRLPERWRPW